MNNSSKSKTNFFTYTLLLLIFFGVFNNALSATEHSEVEISKTNQMLIQEVGTGSLLMRENKNSYYQAANLLSTQAKVNISGPIAQTEITQTFRNTGSQFSEALYIFPLPENAAVEYMELYVGERRIIGKVMEKQAAKKVYIQAKQDGKRAALVEQSRPNLFTTSVANIPAGEQVSVTLRFTQSLNVQLFKSEYQGTAEQHFEYRLPLTLTPRYQPAIQHKGNDYQSSLETSKTFQVSSDDNIFPPQIDNKIAGGQLNQIRIDVYMNRLNAEHEVKSLHQKINQNTIDGQRQLEFINNTVAMDQDFVLQWRINTMDTQKVSFFTETIDGQEYGLLMLNPPDQKNNIEQLPREIIFIIDSSGSMGGESMRQAKESLSYALKQLSNKDRFNIIDFDSNFKLLFNKPRQALNENLMQAQNFVNALVADNGTNMLDALNAALLMPTDSDYLKQIIFITDGSVSNEKQLFTALHKNLKNARLFTVGIGSAPNSYFMRKAAEFGRGTFTYIGAVNQVRPQMSLLFNKISAPILQDIKIEFPEGIEIEKWPEHIPDLYLGETLLVPIQFNQRPDWFTLKARTSKAWEQTYNIDQNTQHSGVASLWARQKISSLMDKMVRGAREESIKPQVLEVALMHQLLSKYTSFIAVDESIVRREMEDLKTSKVPNLLPQGHNYPSTAAGTDLWNLVALLALLMSFIFHRSYKKLEVG